MVPVDQGSLTTSQRQMKSVVHHLEDPFASPGAKSNEYFRDSCNRKEVNSHFITSVTPPEQQGQPTLRGPIQGIQKSDTAWTANQNTLEYVSTHATCALNLVCYRTGTKECELQCIQTVLECRFNHKQVFQNTLLQKSGLISTDIQFFHALRDVYLRRMCGFWRRSFFLKTLRGVRLLSVSTASRLSFLLSETDDSSSRQLLDL